MTAKFIDVPLTEPDYISLTSYERDFPVTYWRQLLGQYRIVTVYTFAIYVLLMVGGRWWMSSRPAFKLDGLLAIWNIGLTALSIHAFSRIAPEFFSVLLGGNGFHKSICEWPEHNGATAFWTWLLVMSKFLELGDTAFIVLRKRELVFLHWYHHITALTSLWIMYYWYEPVQQWYAVMNSFVHTFMYAYYALRALKVRLPRPYPVFILTIELLQMVAAVGVNLYTAWIMKDDPGSCPHRSWFGLKVSFVVFLPFTFLFAKLFIDTFLAKSKSMAQKTEKNGYVKKNH